MKRGREIYKELSRLDDAALLKRMRDLKGGELLALMHYADGLEASGETDLVTGTATLVAAERYFAKARKKQTKKAKEVS
jgi:hypothetical protein